MAMVEAIFLEIDPNFKIQNFKYYISHIGDKFVEVRKKTAKPGTMLNYMRYLKLYAQYLSIEGIEDLTKPEHDRLLNKLEMMSKTMAKENKLRIVEKASEDQSWYYIVKTFLICVILSYMYCLLQIAS